LGTHLHNAHPRGLETFLLRIGGAFGPLSFARGNRPIAEQSLLAAGIRAEELELRFEGLRILLRGIDLRQGEFALGFHFWGNEARERLIFFEGVPLLDKQLHYSSAGARRHMDFVDFDCARDRLHPGTTTRERTEKKKGECGAKEKVRRLQSAARLPTSCGNERHREESKMRRFDHIDLRVKEMAAAKLFYGRLLPELGFTISSISDEWCIWQTPGTGPVEFFGFTAAGDHQPNDNRIAFWAESRAEVDRVAEVVRQIGGLNLEGPALWREYSPGYYALFFEDPSGNKLEICSRESRPT
jgi:predicted enzyme related to lactoylglutathione lyase